MMYIYSKTSAEIMPVWYNPSKNDTNAHTQTIKSADIFLSSALFTALTARQNTEKKNEMMYNVRESVSFCDTAIFWINIKIDAIATNKSESSSFLKFRCFIISFILTHLKINYKQCLRYR